MDVVLRDKVSGNRGRDRVRDRDGIIVGLKVRIELRIIWG